MKLYTNPASPFARKCLIVAHELGLALEQVFTTPFNDENFRRVNPLSKIPALERDDGSVLIDSPVICEYLDHLGGNKFFPRNSARWDALQLQALADGIADAAVARIVESRQTAPNQAQIARHMLAVTAGLDALERMQLADLVTIGEIAVACMLGYVDFRLPDWDWRGSRPKLAAWYARQRETAAMQATQPK